PAGSGSGSTTQRTRGRGGFVPGVGSGPVGGLLASGNATRTHSLSVACGSWGPTPAPVIRPRTATVLPTATCSVLLLPAATGVLSRHQMVYSFLADVCLSATGSRKTTSVMEPSGPVDCFRTTPSTWRTQGT